MCCLGVFAKLPQAGTVKTRLGESIGAAAAAELYSAFIQDIAAMMRSGGWPTVWAYAPDNVESRAWFESLPVVAAQLWPQPAGALGDRLAAFFAAQFAQGVDRVVVIGTDSPTLPPEYIALTFHYLATHDVVLGPATDGGYYLLGLRRDAENPLPPASATGVKPWPAVLFEGIPWSGPEVCQQTLDRIRLAGRSLALLPPWYDIDQVDDLNCLTRHLSALRAAGLGNLCPATQAVLSRLHL